MATNTKELLERLALELGTTVEYLWSVMLKQAYVYAFSSTIELIIILLLGFGIWKVHLFLTTKCDEYLTYYARHEEIVIIPIILVSVWYFFVLSVALLHISNIVTAIMNPEYWALMKILDKL